MNPKESGMTGEAAAIVKGRIRRFWPKNAFRPSLGAPCYISCAVHGQFLAVYDVQNITLAAPARPLHQWCPSSGYDRQFLISRCVFGEFG